MSHLPDKEPEPMETASAVIDLVIEGRPRDLGGLMVRRALPSTLRRHVGPFVFFDHMGPVAFGPGAGIDVRPHPHIALATVTYLFEGEILHRDSLGSKQAIVPGDVNWMIAGRGIVHSERTAPERRVAGAPLHGIQAWVALPTAEEERPPLFEHHPASAMPVVDRPGVTVRVIAGEAYGARSPVAVLSPTLYADAVMAAGAELAMPAGHAQRAAYVVEGSVECDARVFSPGAMIVFRGQVEPSVKAREASRLMLLGGEPVDGERHVWWNFVASTKERIERAKADWKEGRFPKVPGDEVEFIPLPE
jgi:redox-sensitive bicupin YhaK (pirin superfamily)